MQVSWVLWQLVVVQADLMGHLSAIKDYFLLAKGDFYHNFLVEARDLMSMPPRPNFADADIHVPFQVCPPRGFGSSLLLGGTSARGTSARGTGAS